MEPAPVPPPARSAAQKLGALLRTLLPIAVLLVAAFIASDLMRSSPRARRKPRERSARLVEVQTVKMGEQRARVHAMGTVRPARAMELRPRVGGQITRLGKEFVPGGRFKAGKLVAQIDPTDYELSIQERESQVVRARAALRLEQGRQNVAAREYQMLGQGQGQGAGGQDSDLALRGPQLDSSRAELKSAETALERARIERRRTAVIAPFNAIVDSRLVEVGAQVTPSSLLGRLVGTDSYWVEVSLPVDQLRLIDVPSHADDEGSPVRVCHDKVWGQGNCREGRVMRLASGLEEQGRMARLLVTVDDPLSLEEENAHVPAMILGSYVRVEIEGARQMRVAEVDRALLRNGDSVWVLSDKGTLEIVPVSVAFRNSEKVYVVDGLEGGEKLITSMITGAVSGMPLRTGPAPGARAEGRGGAPGKKGMGRRPHGRRPPGGPGAPAAEGAGKRPSKLPPSAESKRARGDGPG
ncbi:MAG: efflux RND transporter periplasmic adaptor subunit [Myxococcales bacterium]|nr:efflux RND transporter periplasmic adaptor subunit [Myxococcales bacterium]